jgi:hypothetical protein
MFSTLRTRFGIPGVISVIALVFAMFGGAYAASNSSGGGKATATASAKGKQGPRGKTGKTGPAGPQGPAGPAGSAGAKGDAGSNGTNGAPGAPGQSVTGTPIAAPGACGEVTGVKYSLGATSTNVCNGKDGETGFTETLPSGATETGTWWIVGNADESTEYFPISFSIPLSESAAKEITVHIWRESEEAAKRDPACKGTPEVPKAEPGTICFYIPVGAESEQHLRPEVLKPIFVEPVVEGVGTSGAIIRVHEAPGHHAGGSFAVTAP